MPNKPGRYLALLGLMVALTIGAAASFALRTAPTDIQQDIYYSYVEGQRILNGENPYARVLEGDMRQNDKYANYFPLFYELSALSQVAGLREYPAWIAFWRVVFAGFGLAVGAAMFWVLYRRQLYLAAVFAVLFWFFNRWTVGMIEIADLEFLSLFLLIVSLELFRKHRWASLLLFSLSLAVKHIAIFMVPVYLIWVWQESPGMQARVKQVVLSLLVIASVPLVTSLPFIAWNAEALVKAIIFEAVRNPSKSRAIDRLVGWDGFLQRLPTLTLLAFAWLLVWSRKVGTYTSALFVQAVFVGVNPVFFESYPIWFFPFIPLVLCDWSDATRGPSGAGRGSSETVAREILRN
jgi:hypothetical protein